MVKKNINKGFPPYILPSTNDELKKFIDNNKLDMMEQVINSIEYAVTNNLPLAEIFQFKNCPFIITISQSDFESNIDNIYKFYLSGEIYELCPRILRLREHLKRNNNETQKSASFSTTTSI